MKIGQENVVKRQSKRLSFPTKCFVLTVLMAWPRQSPAAVIAENGVARTVIVVDPAATATEKYAARQLALTLHQITGADFEVRTNTESPASAIIIGPGAAA